MFAAYSKELMIKQQKYNKIELKVGYDEILEGDSRNIHTIHVCIYYIHIKRHNFQTFIL